MNRKSFTKLLAAGVALFCLSADLLSQSRLDSVLADELNREFKVLNKQDVPVYYLAYRVTDQQSINLEASFGNLTGRNENSSRMLDISLRVGDHSFDNMHENGVMQGGHFMGGFSYYTLPLENNDALIRKGLWNQTDVIYKQAVSRYNNLKSAERDTSDGPDFSFEQSSSYYEPPVANISEFVDQENWEELLRQYSSVFDTGKEVSTGNASLEFYIQRKYFVSSEGSHIVQNQMLARLVLSGIIISGDGDVIPLEKVYYTEKPEDLPGPETVKRDAGKLLADLYALSKAPVAEPYSGPAIFSPAAAGVFFHEIFGHRIEGDRIKKKSDSQTFRTKPGEKILNKDLNVYSDPTLKYYGDKYLTGYYKYDEEGIPGMKVNVVEKGILHNFLMSRKPMGKFTKSNGHGRANAGSTPFSRQSNLFISTEKTYSDLQLRKMLIRKCKKYDLEYGYYIAEVSGGFTNTGRYMPNAFNISPRKVYKIYVDGRPDELVRGVNFIGTPLAMFSEIEAAGDDPQVFQGICGAESGSIPVSTISPELFINKIETQLKPETDVKLPILEKPGSVKTETKEKVME